MRYVITVLFITAICGSMALPDFRAVRFRIPLGPIAIGPLVCGMFAYLRDGLQPK
jgi:hypothetical protein